MSEPQTASCGFPDPHAPHVWLIGSREIHCTGDPVQPILAPARRWIQ